MACVSFFGFEIEELFDSGGLKDPSLIDVLGGESLFAETAEFFFEP